MRDRMGLSAILRSICPNVYFQEPESAKMQYPAIVYKEDAIKTNHADNIKYLNTKRYSITLIDKNPDSVYVEPILALQYCSFDRKYPADNMNHYVFTIYY